MQKTLIVLALILPFFLKAQQTVKVYRWSEGKNRLLSVPPPSYSKQTKSPLIIFLHGIGEKGTGSEEDLKKIQCCGIPKYIRVGHSMTFTWNGKTEGFVVLCPQLYSRYGTWENYYIDAMIKFAKQNLNIDTNRIFLTGLSLGGGASWIYPSASVSNAKKLAGIVPVVSPCFMTNGCNIANANLPVLAIHAIDDNLASPNCTINAIKSINNCGTEAHPNLIMYPNGAHYVWVKRAYDTAYDCFNPNIYEWMLAQNRLFKPNKKPYADAGKNITISSCFGHRSILDASCPRKDPDGKIVRYVVAKNFRTILWNIGR